MKRLDLMQHIDTVTTAHSIIAEGTKSLIPWERGKLGSIPQPELDIKYVLNGIECPQCKSELYDDISMILASNPPQIKVICAHKGCNFVSSRFR